MKMPFGKYKGTEIKQIPRGYLEWIAENTTIKNQALANEIKETIANEILRESGRLDDFGIKLPAGLRNTR